MVAAAVFAFVRRLAFPPALVRIARHDGDVPTKRKPSRPFVQRTRRALSKMEISKSKSRESEETQAKAPFAKPRRSNVYTPRTGRRKREPKENEANTAGRGDAYN